MVDGEQASAPADDDAKLFDEVLSGQPERDEPEPAPEPPQAAPEPSPEPAPAPAAAEPARPSEPPQPGQEPVVRHVPLRELLDERERRQAAERRAEDRDRVLRDLLAKQQQGEQQPAIWDDPDRYVDRRLDQRVAPVMDRLTQTVLALSERQARKEHGNVVDKALDAMNAAYHGGDPEAQAAYSRIMNSPDPYGDLVVWHKRTEVIRDPNAYRQRTADELLKDPAFLQRAIEAHRAAASTNPVTSRPNAAASLPSVSRVGTPAPPEDDVETFGKLTDEEVYDYVRDDKGRFRSR